MEEIEVYFNYRRAITQFLSGIIVIIIGVLITAILERGILVVVLGSFIIGGSLMYFSYKSLSKKAQLIFRRR